MEASRPNSLVINVLLTACTCICLVLQPCSLGILDWSSRVIYSRSVEMAGLKCPNDCTSGNQRPGEMHVHRIWRLHSNYGGSWMWNRATHDVSNQSRFVHGLCDWWRPKCGVLELNIISEPVHPCGSMEDGCMKALNLRESIFNVLFTPKAVALDIWQIKHYQTSQKACILFN